MEIQRMETTPFIIKTACSARGCNQHRDLAFPLHKVSATGKKQQHLIQFTSSSVPKSLLQMEASIKSQGVRKHNLNHWLASYFCKDSLYLRLS